MKQRSAHILFSLLILFCIIPLTISGRGRGRRCRRKKMEPYKKATFTTISGRITTVNIIFNRFKREKGLHLSVKTPKQKYIVHVCPQWYADMKDIKFAKDKSITVSGSQFYNKGRQNIYAASITYGTKTLRLRDPNTGKPLWRSRYRGKRRGRH